MYRMYTLENPHSTVTAANRKATYLYHLNSQHTNLCSGKLLHDIPPTSCVDHFSGKVCYQKCGDGLDPTLQIWQSQQIQKDCFDTARVFQLQIEYQNNVLPKWSIDQLLVPNISAAILCRIYNGSRNLKWSVLLMHIVWYWSYPSVSAVYSLEYRNHCLGFLQNISTI